MILLVTVSIVMKSYGKVPFGRTNFQIIVFFLLNGVNIIGSHLFRAYTEKVERRLFGTFLVT